MNEPRYRRLPGKDRGLFMRSSAWLGPDHILLVEGSRIGENYKRVYFRDIQAMLIMKKRRMVLQSQVLLIPLALFIGVLRLPPDWRATGSLIAVLIMVAVLLYLYIAAFFYGCGFYLATAVGNVYVPSVFRVWQARRFTARILPPVLEAQRDLMPVSLEPKAPPIHSDDAETRS